MKKVILIMCVVFFISCSEKKSVEKTEKSAPEKKELIVKVGLKSNVDDVFSITMNNIEVDEFQKKNIVINETIPVTSNFENITANFGSDNFSKNIYINLGQKLKKVEFNAIQFSYGVNTLIIRKENFNDFLRVNKYAEFNNEDFSITTKKIQNNHNPIIILKQSIIKFLKKDKKQKTKI